MISETPINSSNRKPAEKPLANENEINPQELSEAEESQPSPPPKPRKELKLSKKDLELAQAIAAPQPPAKRGPGRPPKNPVPEPVVTSDDRLEILKSIKQSVLEDYEKEKQQRAEEKRGMRSQIRKLIQKEHFKHALKRNRKVYKYLPSDDSDDSSSEDSESEPKRKKGDGDISWLKSFVEKSSAGPSTVAPPQAPQPVSRKSKMFGAIFS
jgi:hypothetical protein